MERPAKRQCLSSPPGSPAEEVTEEWDLQAARAQNDLRLKSIFEGIFSKYGKDFTDVGDEIDLQTGKIVVDNGHLSGMREEVDIRDEQARAWLYEDDLSDEDAEEDDIDERQEPSMRSHSDVEVPCTSGAGDQTANSSWASTEHHQLGEIDNKPVIDRQNGPDQFQNDRPTDPVWQAPELPAFFSTPKAETKRKGGPKLPYLEREASPPGSGSLWSVPRRGRPRTEVKPKTTPSESRLRAKRKYHSSPVAHDWSFAATPDGDESDDPLQEFQPSPSLSKGVVRNIRGKRMQASTRTARLPSPHARLPPCPSRPDQSATGAKDDNKLQNHAKKAAENHVAFDASNSQDDSPAHSQSHVFSSTMASEKSVKSKRGITPDDAKLVVRMRHIQKKKWNEIHDHLPHRSRSQIYQWNLAHWTERRANPPQLSAPWTHSELRTLERLKDESGLTWLDITNQIPHRTKAEIEFEMLRLWVGDDVWHGHVGRAPERGFEQNKEVGKVEQVHETGQIVASFEDHVEAPAETSSPAPSESDSVKNEHPPVFEDLVDDDDGLIDDISNVSSPSKLSAIHLDSPTASRQGSRTPKRASPVKHLKFTI
ncbi:uncharacterized protein N7484_010528 [Penicillium longicatenatum]|uniref:uncharacterized protein n=1 Tax=Penicillium longicatenatum TaxID=1561947 RepID=UPI0025491FA7|nr:uncharacterized protein N7484_010528 [Penicillium longicatenatum]KAJ5630428.1 hypothetical protein N7484_010528 [Penicillium longicatenatum]